MEFREEIVNLNLGNVLRLELGWDGKVFGEEREVYIFEDWKGF